MTESHMSYFPNIQWKIRKVAGCCRIKGPEFTFLGAKWKLKFAYIKGVDGCKSYIILKRCGNCVKDLNIEVKTSAIGCGYVFLQSSLKTRVSSEMEWILWEIKDLNIFQETKRIDATNILYFLKDPFYFRIDFIPTGCDKYWAPTEPSDGIEQAESAKYSPSITNLCSDFGNLFDNHLMSDVIIECDDQKIHAHKNILAARSQVFAAMFRNDMKESKAQSVTIKDVEPSILKQMIRYMYSGQIMNLTRDNVHDVFVVADKFGVEALKMECGLFMVENPGDTNQTSLTKATDGTDECRVKEAVKSHFANIKAVFCSDEWEKLSEEEPEFSQKVFKFILRESH